MRVRRAEKGIWRKYHDEINAQSFPVDGAHIGNCRRDVAAKHVDDDGIAKFQTQAVGDTFFERHQGRPVVVSAPPLPFDESRAAGYLVGVCETAVALQDPGRVFLWLDVLNRRSAG